MTALFLPVSIGRYTLKNRLVMSPMTRSRSDDATGVPTDLVATYYAQRSTAGLIVTEGTSPSPMGKGYVRTPGVWSEAQIDGWRLVTEAVHRNDGLIFLQLMHCGRISHPAMLPGGATPVAPSAIKPAGQALTGTGRVDFVTPRALARDEIRRVVDEFSRATRNALRAGFDGVELHSGSGYLPEQFLSSGTNHRTDEYGGAIEYRVRFVIEALSAIVAEAGGERVGMKISPEMGFNDITEENPRDLYQALVSALNPLNLAYLHVATITAKVDYHALLRPMFKGAYLCGAGLTKELAEELVVARKADATVFGSLFLANPDLPERFRQGAPLNTPDRSTFYTTGPRGYIDYPVLAA